MFALRIRKHLIIRDKRTDHRFRVCRRRRHQPEPLGQLKERIDVSRVRRADDDDFVHILSALPCDGQVFFLFFRKECAPVAHEIACEQSAHAVRDQVKLDIVVFDPVEPFVFFLQIGALFLNEFFQFYCIFGNIAPPVVVENELGVKMLVFRERLGIGYISAVFESLDENIVIVKLKLDTHDQNLGFFQETGRLDTVMYVLERLAFLHRMRQPSEFSSRHHFAQREIAPDVFFFGCVFQPRPQQPVNHDHGIPRRTLIGERTLGNVSIQCARISFVVVIRTRIRGASVECDHNPP